MCVFVSVMCIGLVLLETRAVSGFVLLGNSDQFSVCVQKCLLRCEQMVAEQEQPGTYCCRPNCTPLCDKSCRIHFQNELTKSNTNLLAVMDTLSRIPSSTPCANTGHQLPNSVWNNVLASCRPCRTRRKLRSHMLREAALIARSVGLKLSGLDAENDGEQPFLNNGDDNSIIQVTADQPSWNLRMISKSIRDDMVTTEVAWDSSPESDTWYLVTWEIESGGLRGNLLTNFTSTSLSLLPDMVYHVQIYAANVEGNTELLLVDTHTQAPSQPLYTSVIGSGNEVVTGVMAAMGTFLILVLFCARKWFAKQFPSKDVNVLQNYSNFKQYPPPVTLFKTMPLNYRPPQSM